ncbi:Transient receptor potential (TRP) domain containing protein [Zymoseptoria brevis]|uniref:Transient receptor potential (TRP) domain containing protein n=1 Tax=Zymoseptoria brevis TaxID=1047168 RepID=A0A0F4GRI4_9PEZI|nr:Transient receptor potential (TRP) domain containing protein [Zymoseptoria brevis]
MRSSMGFRRYLPLLLIVALPASVLGVDVLTTNGFSLCSTSSSIHVDKLDATYDRNSKVITFDVAGSSTESQKVTLHLTVTAYGKQVYERDFDPCHLNMEQMCPVPSGSFAAKGSETIPDKYASQIPSIAFSVPDLDGLVKLEVKSSSGEQIACIQSEVGNGKTFNIPSVKYAAAGMAGVALIFSGAAALASGGSPGATGPSPSSGEVLGWFQGMAMNGMLSVKYPKVYQSFTTNFAFSAGLVEWGSMQTAIDNFRASTGGNVTENNYEYLKNNVTLVLNQDSTNKTSKAKRALDTTLLWARQTTVNVNGQSTDVNTGLQDSSNTANNTSTSDMSPKDKQFVTGIQAYAEQLSIPSSNTFMTILLVWAIVVAAIIVLILIVKVILEAWAQCGTLSKSLDSWRKRYWWRMAKAITNLVLLLYGIWTMWCVYQFVDGDSWAAKVLAGVTLALFTALLAGFSWRIYTKAHQYKKLQGAPNGLYEDKEVWIKYSLFYDSYKKSYWWLFVPVILYMFARGCIIAGANGHGMVQVAGQLIVEALMLILLLWTRPFARRSSQWINITIQTVRVLSVVCILIFVEELGFSQTTTTVTGVVLLIVQSIMTGLLAILIAINAIIACIKENPHRRKRKDAEKARLEKDLDNLTPLNARNSLLMGNMSQHGSEPSIYKAPIVSPAPFGDKRGRYDAVPTRTNTAYRGREADDDDEFLMNRAQPMPWRDHSRNGSRASSVQSREPRLPAL